MLKGIALIDMDGTLLTERSIDYICEALGLTHKLKEIDAQSNFLPSYETSKKIAKLLEGIEVKKIEKIFDRIRINPWSKELIQYLKGKGFSIIIVSESYEFLVKRLAKKLGIKHFYANKLKIVDGKISGNLIGRAPHKVINGCKQHSLCKLSILESIKKRFNGKIIAIGDSDVDICMVKNADIGIAYNPKSEELKKVAKIVSYDYRELIKDLDKLLFYGMKNAKGND
jgi:phosphoserine phosphatase